VQIVIKPCNARESKNKRWKTFYSAIDIVKSGIVQRRDSIVCDDFGNKIYFWRITKEYRDLYDKLDIFDSYDEFTRFCAVLLLIHKAHQRLDRHLWEYALRNNHVPRKSRENCSSF